jgi:hypothetical protein
MDLLVSHWSLAQLTQLLLFGNYAGSIALLYGVSLTRDTVPHLGAPHRSSRVEGVVWLAIGAAGWILPWLLIWAWTRAHLP